MERKEFVLATLLQSTQADIDDYKKWIGLPSQLAQNLAYSASNVLEWIKLEKFNDYLVYKSENYGFFFLMMSSTNGLIVPTMVEPDASSSPAAPTMSSSPFSSPGPILHSEALDETDIDFTPRAYVDSSAVIPPVDEFDGQLMTFTDEGLHAFAAFDFNDPMVDAGGFKQQWQAVLDAFAPPANEWPTLPAPALPSSPRQESSLPSADTTGAPVPAPRKCQRQEVDLKNVIDEPRARKVRKHAS
ncbi:hypothetical protein C8J57DRAFT_1232847 [Mycena rebaudengoi]|nr:hypothetical protein C8J57DRAFT_1232847 [Mycena rebaudengoi]